MSTRSRTAIVLALSLAACSSDSDQTRPSPSSTVASLADPSQSQTTIDRSAATSSPPTSYVPADLDAVELRLELVHPFVEPTAVIDRPGHASLWVTERSGWLTVVDRGKVTRALDLTAEVSTNGERGLLGAEFSNDGAFLYLSYTDLEGDNRVVEYAMRSTLPDPQSRRGVIEVPHAFNAHHGGGLALGPDGMLYIGWGDGEEPGGNHENAASLVSPFGKILRIDPRNGDPYSVPADNPFIDGPTPEVFATGLRNPWRFSFDRDTGDFWVGDVGEYSMEEISFVPSGSLGGTDFGWPSVEGTDGESPSGSIVPIIAYGHDDRCAVIGGYVYRGVASAELRGSYLYGDLCDNRIRAVRVEGGVVVQERDFGPLLDRGLVGFGEDATGELYVLSLPDGVFRIIPVSISNTSD
jgi:glucose/arabinose dehydrogenase